MTQAVLAERLGVDTETLSRFERGKHVPSVATLERLASLLMATIGELLEEKSKDTGGDTLAITSWLSTLTPDDKEFVLEMLKKHCDYLTTRKSCTDGL